MHRDFADIVFVTGLLPSHNDCSNMSSNTLLLFNMTICVFQIHYLITKLVKCLSNNWFGVVICNHIVCWTVFDDNFVSINEIRNVE